MSIEGTAPTKNQPTQSTIMIKTLTARSACDYDCIFEVEEIKRTAKTVTIKYRGEQRRCKIHTICGEQYIFALGQYSMAPMFRV